MPDRASISGSSSGPAHGDDGGFALVVVLLALGVLGLITATFSSAVRSHLRSTQALAAVARAEALADGGIALALSDLMVVREDRTRPRRFAIDGTAVACGLGDGDRLSLSVQDEAGRVDLNSGGEALLLALLKGSGVGGDEAARLVDRLLDFRDRDGDRRPLGAERADYAAAGLPGPKDAPLDAVDELAQVLGADSNLIDRLRPAITVHSGLAGVDPRVMPGARVAMLVAGDAAAGAAASPSGRALERGALPPRLVEISPQQVFAIRSDVTTRDGARFVREAIVDLGPRRARAHVFKRWLRGAAGAADDAARGAGGEGRSGGRQVAALPPC